jgi:hypothetical protein
MKRTLFVSILFVAGRMSLAKPRLSPARLFAICASLLATARLAPAQTLFDAINAATPQTIVLPATTSFDGWSNMTSGSYGPLQGYPTFPGSAAWPAGGIGSNRPASGDAGLTKTGGFAYPAGAGIYAAGLSTDVNAFGATLSISDTSALSGVRNIVLQLEILESPYGELSFFNSLPPLLTYNGGSGTLAPQFSALQIQAYGGAFTPPPPAPQVPVEQYVNLFAFQWDLTALGPVTDFAISWSHVQHNQLYAAQLDQSTQFVQVVPEPATLWLLGAGACALLISRKRFARRS